MKTGRPAADSKPCVKNPWNAGLYCEKHNCDRCGWNPDFVKKIRTNKPRGDVV